MCVFQWPNCVREQRGPNNNYYKETIIFNNKNTQARRHLGHQTGQESQTPKQRPTSQARRHLGHQPGKETTFASRNKHWRQPLQSVAGTQAHRHVGHHAA